MLIMNKFGFLTGEAGTPEVQLTYGDLLQAQVDELTDVLNKTFESVGSIHDDRGLNPIGRQDRIGKVILAARDEIKRLTAKRRKKLEQGLADAQTSIPVTLPLSGPADSVAMILKFQEIRQALCGMNEQERQAEVMIAAENNDLDLLLAVQTAPRILWLVDVDTQQKARQRWLELNKPQEFKTLDTVQGALVIYDHNAHQAIELAGQDAATQRAKTIGQDQPEVVKN